MTQLPSPNVDLSASHMVRKVKRHWLGTPCQQESSVPKRTALIEIELEDGEIIDEVRGPFSKGIDNEYTLHIRLKKKPAPQVNQKPDESTPIRRDINAADARLQAPPNIVDQLWELQYRTVKFKKDIAFLLDQVKPIANIDRTLLELRRDINFAIDRLGFGTFQPEPTAPIPDAPVADIVTDTRPNPMDLPPHASIVRDTI